MTGREGACASFLEGVVRYKDKWVNDHRRVNAVLKLKRRVNVRLPSITPKGARSLSPVSSVGYCMSKYRCVGIW